MWLSLILLVSFRMVSAEEDDLNNTQAEDAANKFGAGLVAQLRNDANLDLSQDEEYEDLRAELLAYHTALAKLSDASSRRSLRSTPCWRLGGICIERKMCNTFPQAFQANACRDKREVCCFDWNKALLREDKEKGMRGPYPWEGTNLEPFQGGLVSQEDLAALAKSRKKRKKKMKNVKEAVEDGNIMADTELGVAQSEAEPKIKSDTLALVVRRI